MSSWDGWLATWRLHARSPAYRRAVSTARAHVREALSLDGVRWVTGVSGGKDSLACLQVVTDEARALGLEVPAVHATNDVSTPEMDRCAVEACAKLGVHLDIVEPIDPEDGCVISVIDWLAESPRENPYRSGLIEQILRATSSGSMLHAYTDSRGFTGAFSGMRADESRGRRVNTNARGALYFTRERRAWTCNPLARWSARDVFATLVMCELPIHPYYRALFERFGVSPESPNSRVDSLIVAENVARLGAVTFARTLYPELWSRLVDANPAIARMEN